jgi:hypothetical protein
MANLDVVPFARPARLAGRYWSHLPDLTRPRLAEPRSFAEARGIVPATMDWWRARLRRGAEAELVPVEVVADDIDTRRRDATPCSVELQVDASTTLRIQAGFDEAELRRLLRVLRC